LLLGALAAKPNAASRLSVGVLEREKSKVEVPVFERAYVAVFRSFFFFRKATAGFFPPKYFTS
jgi:hypothetical protein